MDSYMDTPEFKLTQTELKLIAGIDEFKGKWQALSSLAPEQLTALRKVATVESIASFISLGYEISIVTGRPFSSKALTQQWLAKYNIFYHHLLFVDKYSRTFSDVAASDAISLEDFSRMDFCFAVEDSGYMAGFLSQNMQIPVALLDRPWNRTSSCLDDAPAGLVKRCIGWNEAMKIFHSIKNT